MGNKNGSPQGVSSYQRTGAFLEQQWPVIRVVGVLVALLTFIVAVAQSRFLSRQLEHEISKPVLTSLTYHRTGSRPGLDTIRLEMLDEFLQKAYELQEANPSSAPSSHIESSLPISKSISAASSGIAVLLKNDGRMPAEEVSVYVSWDTEIIRVTVNSLSSWRIVDGGPNQSFVTVSLDRVSVDEIAGVLVEYAPPVGITDTITLIYSETDWQIAFAVSEATSRGTRLDPVVRISSSTTPFQEIGPPLLSLWRTDTLAAQIEFFHDFEVMSEWQMKKW